MGGEIHYKSQGPGNCQQEEKRWVPCFSAFTALGREVVVIRAYEEVVIVHSSLHIRY